MKELAFLLSLKNQLSGPLGKAQTSVEQFAGKAQAAFKKTAVGGAGLYASVLAFKGLTGPAAELQGVLDELSTRDIAADTIEKIAREAGRFSTDFGKSAIDFASSVTVIKSSLAGITDAELPRTARAVNTLAVATKSSSDQAAGYISEFASHFQSEVERIGHASFAENIASKTAWLVKNTGRDLAQIQSLIQGTKGTGSAYGVGIDEQLAIVASLSNTLGTGAGAAYDAFLQKATSGAQALGVRLTDSAGKLLSMPDILDKLQSKYGKSITGNIKLQQQLNKAFGKGAAVLIQSWGSSTKLRKQISDLAGTNGLDTVNGMAAKMADNWARVGQVVTRVRIAIGRPLLKAAQPAIDAFIRGGAQLAKWLEMFPNIARWIGYIAASVIGLSATVAALTLICGVSQLVWTGLKMVWLATAGVVKALAWALNFKARALQLATLWATIQTAVMGKLRAVLLAGAIAVRAYGVAAAFAGGAMAILTSPITLVIGAIALLAAGIWYAVKYWDTLVAAVTQTAAFQALVGVIEWAGAAIAGVWNGIKAGWDAVIGYFSTRSPVEIFKDFAGTITGVFSNLWNYLKSSFGNTYNWLVSKLNKIPGVNIDLKSDIPETGAGVLPAPAGMTAPRIEAGGVGKTIAAGGKIDYSRRVENMNVYPANRETYDSIIESAELAAG